MNKKLGNILALIGLVGFITATIWWYLFFYDILGDRFQLARECFYWTTDACTVASAAAFFADLPQYDPRFLWASTAIFFGGALIRVIVPPGR